MTNLKGFLVTGLTVLTMLVATEANAAPWYKGPDTRHMTVENWLKAPMSTRLAASASAIAAIVKGADAKLQARDKEYMDLAYALERCTTDQARLSPDPSVEVIKFSARCLLSPLIMKYK